MQDNQGRILLIVALEAELPVLQHPAIQLLHCGVGKVNAAWRLAAAISAERPSMVVNFGTAGALRPGFSGLQEVGSVIQHDMDVSGLGFALGETPFEPDSREICFAESPVICASGDRFVDDAPQLQADLVDMELYPIAKICRHAALPLRAFKYITDSADDTAAGDWQSNLKLAETAFQAEALPIILDQLCAAQPG